MSEDRQPNGASPGPDDSAGMFPIETEEDTVSNPEKGQLVYPDSNLVQPKKGQLVYPDSNLVQPPIGQLVYSDSNRVQHSVPGLEPSRKHGVPPSELNTELTSNGNVQQFYGSAESKLHSKSLVNLRSPPDALPETGEGGKKKIMKLPLRQVVSSGNFYGRQPRSRRSRSEGTTPPKDKIEELIEENKKLKESLEKEHSAKLQASSDESVSPLMEQQLKDRIISLEKKVQVLEEKSQKEKRRNQLLQQRKKVESEEKSKFKALYNDEKQRNEEFEKKATQFKEKAAQYKEEITKLQQVVYKLRTRAELSQEQKSLVRSIFVEQGME